MTRYIALFFLITATIIPSRLNAQIRGLGLQEAINLAKSQSPSYRRSQTNRNIAHYNYVLFKSNFKPQALLYGTLPDYNKEYAAITQPDGTIKFQPIFQNYGTLGMQLSQSLPFSGGNVSINSEFNRFDEFTGKTHQYNVTPFFIQLNQPLFGFNTLKWQKKIEPLKLQEADKLYLQEIESISQQAARLYFDVLDALINIEMAGTNLKHATSNYEIENERVNLGTTTKDKLLQLQLQLLSNKSDLEKAKYNYRITQLNLKTFIGYKDTGTLLLTLPEQMPPLHIDLAKATAYARLYRPEFIAFERKRLEAEQEVVKAKANRQQVNITASYGVNNAANNLGKVFQNPNDQQRFSVGFSVPVVDWGRRKANYDVTREQLRLTAINNEFDEINLMQELTTLIENMELIKANVGYAAAEDTVAQQRYELANLQFQMGKLSVTDLNIAQNEKDNARRNYAATLRSYWDAYYQLRRLTLYDFQYNREIQLSN